MLLFLYINAKSPSFLTLGVKFNIFPSSFNPNQSLGYCLIVWLLDRLSDWRSQITQAITHWLTLLTYFSGVRGLRLKHSSNISVASNPGSYLLPLTLPFFAVSRGIYFLFCEGLRLFAPTFVSVPIVSDICPQRCSMRLPGSMSCRSLSYRFSICFPHFSLCERENEWKTIE